MSTVTSDLGHPLTNSQYTEAYIGSEQFINSRDIFNKIFNTYREDEGIADFLLNLGKKKKTDNTTFHHWEDDFIINEGVVGATDGAAVGAGDSETITLNAASHQESGAKSPFMVGDLVLVSDAATITGVVRCQVTAVNKATPNAHTVTLTPVTSTGNISGLQVGSLINWYGSAFADGTLQPDSSVRKPVRFSNDTQIWKTQYETHGSVAANKSEVEINGKPYYYLKGVNDAITKHMMGVNFSLLLGERADNLTDANAPDGSATIYTTEGLEKTIEERGIDQTYATWDYSEIESMVSSLDAERAADEFCALLGTDHFLAHESAMHSRGLNTGIRYDMFSKPNRSGSKDVAVDFGFDSYRTGGRSFHIKKWDALNYTPITGFTSNPYSDMGFWMPMKAYKDAKTEKGLYSVLLRYKANDMENRFMKEWQRDRNVTNKDSFEWNHQTEAGLQLGLVNSYVRTAK